MLIGSDGVVGSGGYYGHFDSVLEPGEEKNLAKKTQEEHGHLLV
jgi:hypothetical protein